MTFVLCGNSDVFASFAPDKGTISREKPRYFSQRAGINALADADQAAIVINLEPRGMIIAVPSSSSNVGGMSRYRPGHIDTYGPDFDREFDSAYVHFLLSRVQSRPPAWVEEGLAQLCSCLRTTDTRFELGKLPDDFGLQFAHQPLLPLQELFAVGYHEQGRGSIATKNPMFSAEAFALVDLCLYGENGRYQKQFLDYVARVQNESATERLFQEIFKMSYREMGGVLRLYVENGRYKSFVYRLTPPLNALSVQVRVATDQEVGRIKGDTLRLAGQTDAARLELLSPYLRDHSDAHLLAAIGFLDYSLNNHSVAERFFSAAAKTEVPLPGPYLYLAELRLAELTEQKFPPLNPAQSEELFNLLVRAQKFPPARADVYRTLAEVWLHTAEVPGPKDLSELDGGVRLFPQDSALVYAVARAQQRAGLTNKAAKLADLGLRFARSDKTKTEFAELKVRLGPTAP